MGIGGDPVPGSSFVDILELFEADPETELVVLSGEIGGSAEEEAADYIAEHMTKPVVAYIAGFTAPAGKQMGHAGAIVSGSSGTAAAKAEALEAKGVRVGRTPTEAAAIAVEVLGGASVCAPSQPPRRGPADRRPIRLAAMDEQEVHSTLASSSASSASSSERCVDRAPRRRRAGRRPRPRPPPPPPAPAPPAPARRGSSMRRPSHPSRARADRRERRLASRRARPCARASPAGRPRAERRRRRRARRAPPPPRRAAVPAGRAAPTARPSCCASASASSVRPAI